MKTKSKPVDARRAHAAILTRIAGTVLGAQAEFQALGDFEWRDRMEQAKRDLEALATSLERADASRMCFCGEPGVKLGARGLLCLKHWEEAK